MRTQTHAIYLSNYPSIYLPIYLPIYLAICPSVRTQNSHMLTRKCVCVCVRVRVRVRVDVLSACCHFLAE